MSCNHICIYQYVVIFLWLKYLSRQSTSVTYKGEWHKHSEGSKQDYIIILFSAYTSGGVKLSLRSYSLQNFDKEDLMNLNVNVYSRKLW